MNKWVIAIFLLLAQALNAKVYDCFIFCNELDLLEIRLHELYDEVDYFVLVEADTTFQGNPKILFYAENAERFAPYKDKIIHVIIRDMPLTNDTWTREGYQRDAITRGLVNCKDDDLILLSDADEILSSATLQQLKTSSPGMNQPLCFELSFRMFWFNVIMDNQPFWAGPVAFRYDVLQNAAPSELRRDRGCFAYWRDCGWHLSNMGGEQAIDFFIYKLQSFSHSECNIGTFDRIGIGTMIKTIGRELSKNDSYPSLVKKNWDEYKKRQYVR